MESREGREVVKAVIDMGNGTIEFGYIEYHPTSGPNGKQRPYTPEDAARGIRMVVEKRIAKTREDYFNLPDQVSALWMMLAIQQQTSCTSEEASAAAAKVCPELYGDYWEAVFFPSEESQELQDKELAMNDSRDFGASDALSRGLSLAQYLAEQKERTRWGKRTFDLNRPHLEECYRLAQRNAAASSIDVRVPGTRVILARTKFNVGEEGYVEQYVKSRNAVKVRLGCGKLYDAEISKIDPAVIGEE